MTSHLQSVIKGEAEYSKETHISQTAASRTKMRVFNAAHHRLVIEEALATLPPLRKRVIDRTPQGHSSGWLTALPIASHEFDLSPTEFRDALAMRYGIPLKELPSHCDSCGEEGSFHQPPT
eukprot:GHVN01044010.1.p1 GENE.GHVN01044010.1~~GHVN01044010.1.p1  ORF type:complete len:121 (-),score=20.34 GHVN01044010.1:7-369(-)